MTKEKVNRIDGLLKKTVSDFKRVPNNSFKKLDLSQLISIFNRYCVDFYHGGGYFVDEVNESVLKTLISLFAQDPEIIGNFDPEIIKNTPGLHKGSYVFGSIGVGKTDFFEIMHKVAYYYSENMRYSKMNFHMIHAGHFVIDYQQADKIGEAGYFYNKHLNGRLLIDELFDEPTYYGKELVKQLILDRYRAWKRNPDLITHITSNATLAQLESRYGDKIPDRIREMCNVIKWPGSSRRDN